LESKGFISSEFDSEDNRVKNVYLAENEASIYDEMDDFKKTNEQKLLQGLTDVQIQELKSLLKAVYENI